LAFGKHFWPLFPPKKSGHTGLRRRRSFVGNSHRLGVAAAPSAAVKLNKKTATKKLLGGKKVGADEKSCCTPASAFIQRWVTNL
jgi:hypothetical protein